MKKTIAYHSTTLLIGIIVMLFFSGCVRNSPVKSNQNNSTASVSLCFCLDNGLKYECGETALLHDDGNAQERRKKCVSGQWENVGWQCGGIHQEYDSTMVKVIGIPTKIKPAQNLHSKVGKNN